MGIGKGHALFDYVVIFCDGVTKLIWKKRSYTLAYYKVELLCFIIIFFNPKGCE